jgi:hypothetical protein
MSVALKEKTAAGFPLLAGNVTAKFFPLAATSFAPSLET